MPASAKAEGPATRKARDEVPGSSRPRKRGPGQPPELLGSWIPAFAGMTRKADHWRLNTLTGAEQIDRLLREVAGALGRDQDQRAAAIGHQAALHKWNG